MSHAHMEASLRTLLNIRLGGMPVIPAHKLPGVHRQPAA